MLSGWPGVGSGLKIPAMFKRPGNLNTEQQPNTQSLYHKNAASTTAVGLLLFPDVNRHDKKATTFIWDANAKN